MRPRGRFAAHLRKASLQRLSQMCAEAPELGMGQCRIKRALLAWYLEIVAGMMVCYAAIRIAGSEEVVSERSLGSNAKTRKPCRHGCPPPRLLTEMDIPNRYTLVVTSGEEQVVKW